MNFNTEEGLTPVEIGKFKTVFASPLVFDKRSVKCLFATDPHYPCNDRDYLRKIFKRKYDFILLGGDLTEGRTKHSPGATVKEPSEKQATDELIEDLKLLKKHNPDSPIFITEGNHDNALARHSGQDVTPLQIAANCLDIIYCPAHLILPVKVDHTVFKILMSHGAGGGGTEQAVLKFLYSLRDGIDDSCDLYLCGHFHKYIVTSDDRRYTRFKERKLVPQYQRKFYMSCGSAIEWGGSYAEGGSKGRAFRSCSIKALEIEFNVGKEIQHRILY